jgi:hypothetical protein
MNIKPYDSKIQKLFLSSFFKIPRFQRPYSWDKGNIEDFWADIIASGKRDHFIGSMVFYTENNDTELFVVDGQQRLTTITIFLAALRDTFSEVGEADLADGIQGVIERPDIGAKKRFVLLTESSFPYFQEYIQKKGAPELDLKPSDEELGMKAAYDYAVAGFKETVDKARKAETTTERRKKKIKADLEACRAALLSLDFIVVQLDNESDAHVVFETLNTRGRDLETKDLVKNLLTKFLPPKSSDVDTTKIRWNEMIQSISSSSANLNTSSYIHHYWLSKFDYTPERTLYEKIKKYLNAGNAADLLTDVHGGVEAYRKIFEPDEFSWKKEEDPVRKSLFALNIFRMRQPTPFVFSILRHYEKGHISLKQARDALSMVERFHFAYTAVAGQSSSGGVSKMYAAAGRDLSLSKTSQERATHLQDFNKKLASRFPDEKIFAAGFSDIRSSQLETRTRPLVRYILEIVDTAHRTGGAVDYSKMTIEHIASQNPKSGKAVANYASIGNLIFVPDKVNSDKLKNKSFSEKMKVLVANNVPLDEVLKNTKHWEDKEIDARTKHLSSIAYSWAKKG